MSIWRNKLNHFWRFFHILVISGLCLSPQAQSLITLPEEQRITVGERFNLNIPKTGHLYEAIDVRIQHTSGQTEKYKLDLSSPHSIIKEPGKIKLDLRLFNVIPLKQISVEVIPETKVYPGGHSIGVVLPSSGVLVTGYSQIINEKGQKVCPAKEVDIRPGDIILEINGQKILNDKHAAKLISTYSADGAKLKILRGKKELSIVVRGEQCSQNKDYRIGLFIRNCAAGVGTLTFFHPITLVYGALGHVITGEGLNQLDVNGGRIVMAGIHGIQPGQKGRPGEKIGFFMDEEKSTGSILNNTPFGIFGFLNKPLIERNMKPLPVAFAYQVKPGKAEILTVIKENEIERFSITIEKVFSQRKPDNKGMIIKVDDPKLLAITGGIIQGMSGSPIIQNGRLVGAVTHVFVNDPTRGYAVLAEWMLLEAEYLVSQTKRAKALFFAKISLP
ncbi:MAG: SpoIVB peptidase [Bacillota bacterium]